MEAITQIMAEPQGARDVVLAPREQIYIQDETKGQINTLVGPYKTSMSMQDKPVIWDHDSRRFQSVNVDKAIQACPFAAEGEYIVLYNPSKNAQKPHPADGSSNQSSDLEEGRRVNLPGPATFPLWPTQHAEVIPGHQLRLNQYLVARVYNDEEASKNWSSAVVKRQNIGGTTASETAGDSGSSETTNQQPSVVSATVNDLTVGQLLIIRGTEVAFYIPPTGIEVLATDEGKYVQEAVTLERMEYAILLNEDGNKRFVQGPAVVFPDPTEQFVTSKDGKNSRKFRAYELNDTSGIYIKVIESYTDEEGAQHDAGEEMFITGKTTPIYYPRPEHSLMKYGDRTVHYAVAIPPGEARYVLNRSTGIISLVKGPTMFLADPRTQVIVKRILPGNIVTLLYPNNQEALNYNLRLSQEKQLEEQELAIMAASPAGAKATRNMLYSRSTQSPAVESLGLSSSNSWVEESASSAHGGNEIQRGTTYAQPRTITIDSKYEGAVTASPYKNYAVLVVSKNGSRRVVVGTETAIFEYDELPMPLALSTSNPKNTDKLYQTAYLQIKNNKVSDTITVETQDSVKANIKVSYRVNFTGEDPEKWFEVENYVKFLCDHMRSLLRNTVKAHKIQQFYSKYIDITRDVILGSKETDGSRKGRMFEENGMLVYEVEVLGIEIADNQIAKELQGAQFAALQQMLEKESLERQLEATRAQETVNRKIADEQSETNQHKLLLQGKMDELNHKIGMQKTTLADEMEKARLQSSLDKAMLSQKVELSRLEYTESTQATLAAIAEAELARQQALDDQRLALTKAEANLAIAQEQAATEAIKERMESITPELAVVLQAFSDKDLMEKLSENMSFMANIKGTGIIEVVSDLLSGHSKFEDITKGLGKRETATR